MTEEPGDLSAAPPDPSPLLDPVDEGFLRDSEFRLFHRAQMPRLVAFLMVQGAPADAAADVAQDAMIEAYRHWDDIDAPRAWVRLVATRGWGRRARRDRAEVPHDDLSSRVSLLSPDDVEAVEAHHTFLAMVRDLPELQRHVMAWTYDGYQPTEIAVFLGKNPATVRSALRDARETLRRRYRPGSEGAS